MTVLLRAFSYCPICGQKVNHRLLVSTNSFGSPDLDFRPAGMHRSTMPYWHVQCPECGYVAKNFDRRISWFEKRRLLHILKTEQYKKCDGLELPDHTSRRFYQQYLLYKDVAKDYELFHYLKCCVWACDDFGPLCEDVTKSLRIKVIPYLERAIRREMRTTQKEQMMLLLADFYRRSEQFREVEECLQNRKFKTEGYDDIAAYQLELAGKKDSRRHSIRVHEK